MKYICEPWSRVRRSGKFLGAAGFAKANFNRHRIACAKKKDKSNA